MFRARPDQMNDPEFSKNSAELSKMFDGWLKIDFDDMAKMIAKGEKKGIPYYFEGGNDAAWRQAPLSIVCHVPGER